VYYILKENNTLAISIFFLALLTELDGAIARKWDQTTSFGALYDPLVDGLFMAGELIALLYMHKLSYLLIGLLIAVNIPRVIFIMLFQKKAGKPRSTVWSKLSGLLSNLIIPLALLNFKYLNEFIIFIIIFTLGIMIKRGKDYSELIKQ
jgi:phosphatidylglycerophosphate synthase